MIKRIIALLVISAVLGASGAAQAQRSPWPSNAFAPEVRNVPGKFDYYTLVLSWSPTHCVTTERGTDDSQCARDDGARYGFVLHGLWPQYEKGYPERCHTRWRPYVPQKVIDSVFDVMPSRRLVIHEYRQHGTCSGLRPAYYFALARQFFGQINIPKRYLNPIEARFVSPRDVLVDFLRANPRLTPDMIAVTCSGGPGNRLRDVRICLTREGQPRACGVNEGKGTACHASRMLVPPVRSRLWDYEKNRLPVKKRPSGAQRQRNFTLPR